MMDLKKIILGQQGEQCLAILGEELLNRLWCI